MSSHSPSSAALTGTDWLANELADLGDTSRLLRDSGTNERTIVDRLMSQALIHVALMEEVVYPALLQVRSAAPMVYRTLHQALRDAAEALTLDDKAPQPRIQALLDAIATLIAHEGLAVAPLLRASGVDASALGVQLAKRQEELMTAGPAR